MKAKILGLLALGLLMGPIAASAALFSYSGDTTGQPTFNRPVCGSAIPPVDCLLSGVGTDVRYSAFAFTVDMSASYTMVNTAGTLSDSVFVLYQNSFDPMSPLSNVFAYNDDAVGLRSRIIAPLVVGTSYFLVTTSFANNGFGTFTNEIRGDGNVIPSGTVPEPGTLALLGLGLAGLGLSRRRKA